MARKAARLERAGALTPRDRMWGAMRALQITENCSWSAVEVQFLANANVAPESHTHVHSVLTYLEGLSKAQPPYVVQVFGPRPTHRSRKELALWRLMRDVGVEAPSVNADGTPTNAGRGNQQIWDAIRTLREFDPTEVAAAASTPQHAVQVVTVKKYFTPLLRAGYLRLSVPSKPGTQARYRFVRAMNTGPRAPLLCRDKSVMDANTGTVVFTPSKGGKECREQT